MPLHLVDHPLVHDALMELRDPRTPPAEFRRAANRISVLLAAEALRDVASTPGMIDTRQRRRRDRSHQARRRAHHPHDLHRGRAARRALLERQHPDVEVFTPVVDRELNADKFIVPGLGDFGDRLYGTI